MTVGEKIYMLRKQHNMTMDDLARELGVQRSAINKYEKGIVVNLRRSPILNLCRVFGVPSSYFLEESGSSVLADEEQRLLSAYRHASAEIRSAALAMLETSAENNRKTPASGEAI